MELKKSLHTSFNSKWFFCIIIFIWFLLNLMNYWYVDGDDLASGYIAAKLLNDGKVVHVYAYSDTSYSNQDDPLWSTIALNSGFYGRLHPYVQIPIYAYILQPLAVHYDYNVFKHVFLCIILTSMMANIILAFKLWSPELLRPIPFIIFLLLFSLSIPYPYSMRLLQTHPIILFFNISGIYLERKNKPLLGGLFLSIAIAIKLIPALILVYWLILKRFRAIIGTCLGLFFIGVLSLTLVGVEAHVLYLQRLQQINAITLVIFNNQSVRAFLVRLFMDTDAMFNFKMHKIPLVLSAFNVFLSLLLFCALAIKIRIDKAQERFNEAGYLSVIFILQTICSPIAWTHYFTILFIPFAVVYRYIKKENALGSKIFFWCLVALNFPVISPYPYRMKYITGNNIILFALYASFGLYLYLIFYKRVDNDNFYQIAHN